MRARPSDTGNAVDENMIQVMAQLGAVDEVFRHGLFEEAACFSRVLRDKGKRRERKSRVGMIETVQRESLTQGRRRRRTSSDQNSSTWQRGPIRPLHWREKIIDQGCAAWMVGNAG